MVQHRRTVEQESGRNTFRFQLLIWTGRCVSRKHRNVYFAVVTKKTYGAPQTLGYGTVWCANRALNNKVLSVGTDTYAWLACC